MKASKKKGTKNKKIYDDDELDAASEYDSIGSADADKLIARQICEYRARTLEWNYKENVQQTLEKNFKLSTTVNFSYACYMFIKDISISR